MQITAPIHRIASYSRDLSERRVTQVRGHRQRRPLHLPWQLNLAATGLIGLGIAACVFLQM
jgi:hypothetical protein